MTWRTLSAIAYRDLGRNRRRTALTVLAVALGLAILMMLNGLIAGVMADALANSIRLRTGHVQLRAASYDESTWSLAAADLVGDLDEHVSRAMARPEVETATPVLWAAALLNTPDETLNLQLIGMDPRSAFYHPIREAMVAGEYLAPDDRSGILLGQSLAATIGATVGGKVNLAVANADGQLDEGPFTVRGLFRTGILNVDEGAILMPLDKAQAFARAGKRASAIILLLHDPKDSSRVAAALAAPGMETLDWRDLNAAFVQTMQASMGLYVILDLIVMLVVAVVIANTLLMAIFERMREMGILAALGMRRRQVLQMVLLEAGVLSVAGIGLGLVLGTIGVAYLAAVGISIGAAVASARNVALSSVMRAQFVPGTFAWLAAGTLGVSLLAALYPAWFASRLEPAEALHQL